MGDIIFPATDRKLVTPIARLRARRTMRHAVRKDAQAYAEAFERQQNSLDAVMSERLRRLHQVRMSLLAMSGTGDTLVAASIIVAVEELSNALDDIATACEDE